MADLSLTAASLVFSAAALRDRKRAIGGSAIAIGDIIWINGETANLADANSGTAAARVPAGMACSACAASGQPLEYIDLDTALTIGAHGLAVNVVLMLSRTAGKMCLTSDLTTGDYGVALAIVKSATQIAFNARTLLQSGAATT